MAKDNGVSSALDVARTEDGVDVAGLLLTLAEVVQIACTSLPCA